METFTQSLCREEDAQKCPIYFQYYEVSFVVKTQGLTRGINGLHPHVIIENGKKKKNGSRSESKFTNHSMKKSNFTAEINSFGFHFWISHL